MVIDLAARLRFADEGQGEHAAAICPLISSLNSELARNGQSGYEMRIGYLAHKIRRCVLLLTIPGCNPRALDCAPKLELTLQVRCN